ncbi:hypothetical protein pb186bvf_019208 [Paramecium bursaria]
MFFNQPLKLYQYQKVRQYPEINKKFQKYFRDDTILTTLDYQYQIPLEGFLKILDKKPFDTDQNTKFNFVIDLIKIINQQNLKLDIYKEIIVEIHEQRFILHHISIHKQSQIYNFNYVVEIGRILNKFKINIKVNTSCLNELNGILISIQSKTPKQIQSIQFYPSAVLFMDRLKIFDSQLSRQIITLMNYYILVQQQDDHQKIAQMSQLMIEQIYEMFIKHIDILVKYFSTSFNESVMIFSDILIKQEYLNSYDQINTLQNTLIEKFLFIEYWLKLEEIRQQVELQFKPILNLQYDKILYNEKAHLVYFIIGQHEKLLKQPIDEFLKLLMNECMSSIEQEVKQQIRHQLNDIQ